MPRYEGSDGSKATQEDRSWAIMCSVGDKIAQVNEALTGKPQRPFKQAFTVTDAARPRHIIVLALYSSDTPGILEVEVPRLPEAAIEGIHGELCKAFGTVAERPMWHWDEDRHGTE